MGTSKVNMAQQIVQVGQQKQAEKRGQAKKAKANGSVWTEGYAKKSQNEVVKGKVKGKNGNFVEKEYTKLKNLENGRSLVVDANGKQWVMSHDGFILKQEYLDKSATDKKTQYKATNNQLNALYLLIKEGKNARKSFDAQMAKDGWAADAADGISKLWNNKVGEKLGISTGNTASQVREDFKIQNKNIKALKNAAMQGEEQFNATFKKIYGVNYDQKAIDNYRKNPTEDNYKKAFGTKQKNMKVRVDEYNKSQDAGATAVKTTAKIGVGVGVGLATGGIGLAVGTAVGSAIIEETDRVKVTGEYKDSSGKTVNNNKGGYVFKEGTDHGKILKGAVVDGVMVYGGGKIAQVATKLVPGKVLTNAAGEIIAVSTVGQKVARTVIAAAGDGLLGAGAEYVQTGEVTTGGVAANMALSFGVGSAVEFGLPKIAFDAIKRGFSGKGGKYKVTSPKIATTPKTPSEPYSVQKSAVKSTATQGVKKAYNAPKTQQAEFVPEEDMMASGFWDKLFGNKKSDTPVRHDRISEEAKAAAKEKMKASQAAKKKNNPAGIEIVDKGSKQNISSKPVNLSMPTEYSFKNTKGMICRKGNMGYDPLRVSWNGVKENTQIIKKNGKTYLVEINKDTGWRDGDYRGFEFEGDIPQDVCLQFCKEFNWQSYTGTKEAIDKMNTLLASHKASSVKPKPATTSGTKTHAADVTEQQQKPTATPITPKHVPTQPSRSAGVQQKLEQTKSALKTSKKRKYKKPETNVKSKYNSVEDVYTDMDKIHERLNGMRDKVQIPYDMQLKDLSTKQAHLDEVYSQNRTSYKASINKTTQAMDNIHKKIKTERAILEHFTSKCDSNAQTKLLLYEHALKDLEKAIKSGKPVSEIGKYAPTRQKRFIGAEFKDNIHETIFPDNAPSYFHDEEIADFFHYKDINGLRQKVNNMRARFSEAKSRVDQQTAKLKTLDSEHRRLAAERKDLEDSVKNIESKYYQDKTDLNSQESQVQAKKESAMSELKNSNLYKSLNAHYKLLQNALRNNQIG